MSSTPPNSTASDAANWDGSQLTLFPTSGTQAPNNATMPYPPNGSTILAFQNESLQNNIGKLSLTNGGAAPKVLTSPALLLQPNILVGNWGSAALGLTNISVNPNTPIWVAAYGPGIPPQPGALEINTHTPIAEDTSLQGVTLPQYMQLSFQYSGGLALFGFIGGPVDASGNNAYVVALNSSYGNTGGPPSSKLPPAPAGYYATSGGNNWSFEFNWGTSILYVAYFGSGTVVPPAAFAPAMLALTPALPTVTLTTL